MGIGFGLGDSVYNDDHTIMSSALSIHEQPGGGFHFAATAGMPPMSPTRSPQQQQQQRRQQSASGTGEAMLANQTWQNSGSLSTGLQSVQGPPMPSSNLRVFGAPIASTTRAKTPQDQLFLQLQQQYQAHQRVQENWEEVSQQQQRRSNTPPPSGSWAGGAGGARGGDSVSSESEMRPPSGQAAPTAQADATTTGSLPSDSTAPRNTSSEKRQGFDSAYFKRVELSPIMDPVPPNDRQNSLQLMDFDPDGSFPNTPHHLRSHPSRMGSGLQRVGSRSAGDVGAIPTGGADGGMSVTGGDSRSAMSSSMGSHPTAGQAQHRGGAPLPLSPQSRSGGSPKRPASHMMMQPYSQQSQRGRQSQHFFPGGADELMLPMGSVASNDDDISFSSFNHQPYTQQQQQRGGGLASPPGLSRRFDQSVAGVGASSSALGWARAGGGAAAGARAMMSTAADQQLDDEFGSPMSSAVFDPQQPQPPRYYAGSGGSSVGSGWDYDDTASAAAEAAWQRQVSQRQASSKRRRRMSGAPLPSSEFHHSEGLGPGQQQAAHVQESYYPQSPSGSASSVGSMTQQRAVGGPGVYAAENFGQVTPSQFQQQRPQGQQRPPGGRSTMVDAGDDSSTATGMASNFPMYR